MAIIRIQHRRDTSAKWTSVNPVLFEGEIGVEKNTGRMKLGDGVTPWNSLGYTRDITSEDVSANLTPEAVEANLPERLSPTELTATIASGAAKGAVLADVAPTKTATANRTALLSAFSAAQTEGRDVEIPSTVGVEEIQIDGELLINGAGNIRVYTPHSCRIKQTVKPEPIFNVMAPNVTIDSGFIGVGSGLDMTGMVSAINYARYAGVWLNANSSGSIVRNFKGIGVHRAVRVDPDGTTTATPAEVPNIGNLILDGVESENCWAGVSAVGFNSLTIRNLRGNYKKATNSGGVDTTGAPPHLLYVIDREPVGRLNYNLDFRDALCWDGDSGDGEPAAAYAIKGVRGLTYDGLQARNCPGILDLINIENVSPGSAVSIDDVYPAGSARASISMKASNGAHIRGTVRAKAGGDYGRQLFIESTCNDCLVEADLTISNVTENLTETSAVARVAGKRNELRSRVHNIGAAFRTAIDVRSGTAESNRVVGPKISGNFLYPVEVLQGVDTLVEYESDLLPALSGVPVRIDSAATSGTVLRDRSVTSPGYLDTFTRADSDNLVRTENGQKYKPLNGGLWRITGGMLECRYAGVGGAIAFPAGGSPDGTIRIKIGAVGTALGGYYLRADYTPANGAATPQDYLRLQFHLSSSDTRPVLQVRSNGGSATTLAVADAGVTFVAGDVIEVAMAGQAITVKQNGTTVITATDTVHNQRPASGPYQNASTGTWKYDEIQFTPA